MRKLFTAIESTVIVDEADLEKSLLEQVEAIVDLDNEIDREEQAKHIIAAINQAEIANTPEESYAIAKEQLLALAGYTHAFSLEDFNTKSNKVLNIAQEGIITRTLNALGRLFTTGKSFKLRLDTALLKLRNNGSKHEKLVDPGWSKYLIANSVALITPKDVINYINALDNIIDQNTLDDRLIKAAKLFDRFEYELRKKSGDINFETPTPLYIDANEANSDFNIDYQEVHSTTSNLHEESFEEITALNTLVAKYHIKKNIDLYPDYEPIDFKTASSIGLKVFNNFIFNENDTVGYRNYISSYKRLKSTMLKQHISSIRFRNLLGTKAGPDLQRSVISEINNSVAIITKIYHYKAKVAYAFLRYVEDSSN
jgi:hypothetical protein